MFIPRADPKRYRTIIAGPRHFTEPALVDQLMLTCPWYPQIVISGAARGFDKLGEGWAIRNGLPLLRVPCTNAEWMEYGAAAGPFRNERMITIHKAEALCAAWDGESRGTGNMIELAEKYGLLVHLLVIENEKAPAPEGAEIDDDDVPF